MSKPSMMKRKDTNNVWHLCVCQLPPSTSVCCWLSWRCPQPPGTLRGGQVSTQGVQSWTHCCTRAWLLHTSPLRNIYRPPGGGEAEELAVTVSHYITEQHPPSTTKSSQHHSCGGSLTCCMWALLGPLTNSSSSARRFVLAKAKISSVSTYDSLAFFRAIWRNLTKSSQLSAKHKQHLEDELRSMTQERRPVWSAGVKQSSAVEWRGLLFLLAALTTSMYAEGSTALIYESMASLTRSLCSWALPNWLHTAGSLQRSANS